MRNMFKGAARSLLKRCGYSVVRTREGVADIVCSPLDHERDSLGYDIIWSQEGFARRKYLDRERLRFYHALRDHIKSRVDIQTVTSVVDVGCGPGYMLRLVAELNPEAKLMGLDFSAEVLKLASEICPSATFQKHDIYDELEETSDLAVCSEVLEHLDYPRKALDQLTCSTSSVVLTVPNGRTDTYPGHINFWSMRSWEVFLESYTTQWKCETCFLCEETRIVTILRKRIFPDSEL